MAIELKVNDDLDDILSSFDWEQEVDSALETIPDEKVTFKCAMCPKVCLSKRGLTRHTNSKHKDSTIITTTTTTTSSSAATTGTSTSAEQKMHPAAFKKILTTCITKLSVDECYPSSISHEFKNVIKFSSEDSFYHIPCYDLIKSSILKFIGNIEKFYPSFSKLFNTDDSPFRGLGKQATILLGFELSSHVLS